MTMMKRRVVLAGIAAAVTTPAFAQNPSARGAGSASADDEKQWIAQTMPIGALSLAVSRIAEQKVRFPKLKEFAQFEVGEQETVADVLKSLENPGQVSGTVKPPSEAELQASLDQNAKQTVEKMRSAPAGAVFDREYLEAQIQGHEQLLRIQEDYLKSGRGLGSVNVAKLARGMIKEHLQLLADIRGEMGSGNTTGAAPRNR
jgi:putative membrane protein